MAQITILNNSNVPQGPFTRSEVAQRLQSGEFTPASLAFMEGLSQWTPLRDVLAKVDAEVPLTAVAPPPAILPPLAQRYSYAATMQPPPHLVYAGFWLRFVAYFLDSLILSMAIGVILVPLSLIFIAFTGTTGSSRNFSQSSMSGVAAVGVALIELVVWVGLLVGTWLYFAMMESGPSQATLGKRVLGLRVTTLSGERISFGQASGRFFGKIVSGMTFYIGYIMAGLTERKQALHDMMAGTLVVKG
jgi:uncharacterized RDD family membrane protein YckC